MSLSNEQTHEDIARQAEALQQFILLNSIIHFH